MAFDERELTYDELYDLVEDWRERAEHWEALVKGDRWNEAVRPLSLQQTRIARVFVRLGRPLLVTDIVDCLSDDYRMSELGVKVQVSRWRQRLPDLSPSCRTPGPSWGGSTYMVSDLEGLADFLGEKKWDAPASEAARPSEITETNPTGAESAMQEASICQM